MQKQNKQMLIELIRPPVQLVGSVVKTIYRLMFGWWLDPWLQRRANQLLIEDIRAKLPFLFYESIIDDDRSSNTVGLLMVSVAL